MTSGVQEVKWVQSVLNDLDFDTKTVEVYCDNQSAIKLVNNPVKHGQT